MSCQFNLCPASLTFRIGSGVGACVAAEEDNGVSISHLHRITRERKLLTCLLLGPLSALLIWCHFDWPENWSLSQQRIDFLSFFLFLTDCVQQLTSTTTTSTFTFSGRFSSAWKCFTMATSRWIVARRSLLWMTDSQTTENKHTNKKKSLWIDVTKLSTILYENKEIIKIWGK